MANAEKIRRRLVPLVQEGIIMGPIISPAHSITGREAFTVTVRPAKGTKLPLDRIGQIVRKAAMDLDVELILDFLA